MAALSSPAGRLADVLRWSVAALAALALHGTLAWLAVNMPANDAEAAAGAPQSAIMVELAALAPAPETPAMPPRPAPEPDEAVADDPPDPAADRPEAAPASPSGAEAETEPAAPSPWPSQPVRLDIPLPELPPMPGADAMLPAPEPVVRATSAPRISPPKRPDIASPKPDRPVIMRRRPADKPKRTRQAASPPPAARQATAPTRDERGRAAQPSLSIASWRSSLLAHLNRYKHFPEGARPAVVRVAFAIDGQGRVLSARLAQSSGDAILDAEAVAMIRRASPVPTPPAGMTTGAISLTVPVRYTR